MRNISHGLFTRTALSAAVAIVAAAPAWAQNTTSAVNGTVVGVDGKPAAGALVTIVHRESGSTNNLTTDADGRYAARGLRVGGPYTITVSKGGVKEVRDDIYLQLAESLNLDLVLSAVSLQTVTVTGTASRVFNRSNMGAGTQIGSRELESYASLNRNLQDYARLDPRLAQTDKERGEISAAGQNTRYNSVTIDGVTINDTFGLESNNLPTAKQPISIDAIQSVQVNLSNYDVTQKGYTGANINAVTKSGTNQFKGRVSYDFRSDSLAGDRLVNNLSTRSSDAYISPPSFKEDTKSFSLGGPIIKDQLFFFVNYEELKSNRNAPDFGPIGSSRTNVAIRPEAINQAISIARDTWGFDAGSPEVPQGTALSVKDSLLKLDWNINEHHRANVRYTKTEQTEPIFVGLGAGSLSLSSHWYSQAKEIETVVGQWFADWTPELSSEVKISRREYDSRPTSLNGTRLPQVTLQFSGPAPAGFEGTPTTNRSIIMGTERSRHFNILSTKTDDLYFAGTWLSGQHEVKFGVDYSNNEVYNAFLQDTNGQYRFQCEPGTYRDASGANFTITNCNTATAAQIEAAVLQRFQAGTPTFYQAQLPRTEKTLNDGVAIWSAANLGVFLQDTWSVAPSVNVSFGARVDRQAIGDTPLFNAAAALPAGAPTALGRATGGFGRDNRVTLDGNVLVQPRVGFNWNLDSDTRSQLRGGFGLFQGAAANVWLSNPFSNTGTATATLNCSTAASCATANARFNPNPGSQPVLTGVPPAANVDFLAPNLEQPSVWKMNLAYERELPELPVVGKTIFGAEWLHTKTNSGLTYEHLNLGAPTRTGADGRQMFWISPAYNPACWNANGSAITSGACVSGLPGGQRTRAQSNADFGNVLLAKPTSGGGGNAITLSLSQPTRDGLGWMVAHTRTSAKDVNPLTSSVSNSNWQNRNIFNPNEDVLQNSNYLIRDRISANINWSKPLVGKYRTTVGLVYEGRSGKPYSWTFANDMNGDGIGGNDLMYIPSAPGSGEVTFRGGAEEEARFWEVVEANSGLRSAKGGVVGRNDQFAPWVNTFDLRLGQELPGFAAGQKGSVLVDIFNFGNLINKRWGRISEIGFPSNRSFVNYVGVDANGKYVYSMQGVEALVTRQEVGESQWAAKITLRYDF